MGDENVNSPAHYNKGEIECIEAIRAALTDDEYRGFCKGTAIAYLWRERFKGKIEDIKKAKWYILELLEQSFMEEEWPSDGARK